MECALSEQHRKWIGWLRVLVGFTSVQIFIQGLTFLSGILIVRHLSKADYAWFTIANTFAATLGMLADSGVSAALSSMGGAVWQDNVRLGSLIRTAIGLRRVLALVTALVVAPVFVWMLVKNQAPATTVAVVVVAALAGFYFQLTASVLGVVISLRQEIVRMQRLGVAAAVLRLSLVVAACLVFFDARVAVIIGVCSPALQACFLQRWVRTSIIWDAPVSAEDRVHVWAVVKKQAPLTIFYCLQGQIVVWLISVFGSEERVAEIGALGRFAMIFTVVSSVMGGIVVPRFARCQDPSILRRRYWQVAVGFALLAGALVVLSAAFPDALICVLGAKYANLEKDVWLMMLNAAMGALFATQSALTYSKAWIAPAIVSIPMEIVTQVVLIQLFDITTVRGVLWLGTLSFIPLIILNVLIAFREMKKCLPLTDPVPWDA